MTPNPSFRDVEKLSAYLDGQLKPSEKVRLEARLQTEPELASVLQDLRQAHGVLRGLPQRRAPRNFTLTPKMVGLKPPMPRTYPVFRFATVLATLLLFFTFATNFMAPRLARTAPSAPYGIGAGGGDAEPELAMEAAPQDSAEPVEEPAMEVAEAPAEPAAPAAEESAEKLVEPEIEAPSPAEGEPAEQEIPAPVPTEGGVTADDSARAETAQEQNGVEKSAPGETYAQDVSPEPGEVPPPAQLAPPISAATQILLAGLAIASGIIALILRYTAIRKWRAKAK
jgi:anti-sigma factor RsiW